MPTWIPDVGAVVLILGITYALMSEGLWGAALMFFNILFSGLIAFNFYEWVAMKVAGMASAMVPYADMLSFLLIFIVTLVLMRITTESIAPAMVRFPAPVYHIGRILFAFGGACLTISILLIAFHLAPVHKKMFGSIDYDARPPFGQGLDHKWLSFFQYTTGQVFASYGNAPDPHGQYGDAKVFDPRGRWLIDHQNARPFGDDFVPEPPTAPAAGGGAEGGDGSSGGPGGGMSSGGPGGGYNIPGGTGGAAVGLAPGS